MRALLLCARPKTQILDIAHGLHLALEKALDDHSRGAVAQADIEKYYDSIRLLRVVRGLVSKGCPVGLAACALRQQMVPHVSLNMSGVEVTIRGRSRGSMTGSRVAGTLARVPVEDTIQERHAHWKRWGYKCDAGTLTVSTYVDNLYSVSHSLAGATAILDDFERVLASKWCLRIKPSSRLCLVARGSRETPVDPNLWTLCSEFPVLGHILQDSDFTSTCFQNTSRSMWRAFFANSGAATVAKLSVIQKLRLLERSVVPVLHHRDTRWPPNRKTADNIDKLQRKMVASIQRMPRTAGETPCEYVRRRNRAATAEIRRIGAWSTTHSQRTLAWDSHCRRPANSRSWAAMLLDYHGESWLTARRLANQRDKQSRLNSRTLRAPPAPRWHEGVNYARYLLR